ncbi:MAG: DUF126 domain-containing protein [Gammaproteobacteria bacterium]|nr:DUF126 domain-containing protein [Gammaproteobacteria bacterium]
MELNHQADVVFAGDAAGEVLRLDSPISFWGGVDPVSAKIVLGGHPQHGLLINGKMLVIPQLIGSSSSSAILLELLYRGIAPKALILGNGDAILPIGVLIASQMDWETCPVVKLMDPPFKTGDRINISHDGLIQSY